MTGEAAMKIKTILIILSLLLTAGLAPAAMPEWMWHAIQVWFCPCMRVPEGGLIQRFSSEMTKKKLQNLNVESPMAVKH